MTIFAGKIITDIDQYEKTVIFNGHDVDILVEFDKEKPIGLLKFAGIICDLEDLIGHKVDLVEEGTLKSYAVESVNRDKKMIYEREEQG